MTYPSPSEQQEPETTPATPTGRAPPQYSPDGRWYWNGWQWRPVLAHAPAWGRPYAPPDRRAITAVTLVGLATGGLTLFLLGEVLFPVFNLLALVLAFRFETAFFASIAAFFALLVALSLSLAAYAGAAIAVPMWMHRCYRNLPALGATDLRWSPAMAAGAWFIPFANVVLPCLIARELSLKASGSPVPSWLLLGLWWPAYIAVVLINQIRHFNFRTGNGLVAGVAVSGDLFDSLAALAALATVVEGGLLIVIIWLVTRRQRDRYAELLRGI